MSEIGHSANSQPLSRSPCRTDPACCGNRSCLPSSPATRRCAVLSLERVRSDCCQRESVTTKLYLPSPQAGTWICPLNCWCAGGSFIIFKALHSFNLKPIQKLVGMKRGETRRVDVACDHIISFSVGNNLPMNCPSLIISDTILLKTAHVESVTGLCRESWFSIRTVFEACGLTSCFPKQQE